MRTILTIRGSLQTIIASERDKKVLPPAFRSFVSPDGSFVLEIQGPAGWKSPYVAAGLFRVGRSSRRQIWSQTLPHRFGPATALVSDSGRVLLVNEGMNTPSPRSITLLDETGREVAHYSVEQISVIAGVSVSAIIRTAQTGLWMSAPMLPVWQRNMVIFETGGVRLNLDLATGKLARVSQQAR